MARLVSLFRPPELNPTQPIPQRLTRGQVHHISSEETNTFRYHGLLRRQQARQAQPIEIDAGTWTQTENIFRLPAEENTASLQTALDEEALRAKLEAEWQQKLEVAIAQAQAEGEAAGRAAAEAEWRERLLRLQEQWAEELEQLRQAWYAYVRQLEPLLVEMALDVAEALLDAPLAESLKGVSARVLAEAIEHLARETPIEISLHPVDFLRLQEQGVIAQLESRHPDLRWQLNPALKEGDWIVQTPAAMRRSIRQELLQTLRQRLGLLPAASEASGHAAQAQDPHD